MKDAKFLARFAVSYGNSAIVFEPVEVTFNRGVVPPRERLRNSLASCGLSVVMG